MGWFDEQIRLRKLNDEVLLEESFLDMAGSVMGRQLQASLESNRIRTKNAIDAVLQSMGVRSRDIPDNITELNDQLDYLLEPHGIMRRAVSLPPGWYKDAAGSMLMIYKEGSIPVAVLPGKINGYEFTDPVTLKKCRINDSTQKLFEETGLCFYKPFPQKKLGIKDLLLYMALSRSVSDHAMILISSAILTGIGAILPMLTKLAYGGSPDQAVCRDRSGGNDEDPLASCFVFSQIQRRRTLFQGAVDIGTVQTACIGDPLDGSDIAVLAGLHCTGFPLYAGSCGAGTDHHAGHSGVFSGVNASQYCNLQRIHEVGRSGKRHELCHDHRNPEDQACRRGETRICALGKTVFEGSGVHV